MSFGGRMSQNTRLSKIEEQIQQLKARADKIKAGEREKLRKEETRDKILLGVILQGMIKDGRIPAKFFEESLETYITTDKDRDRCDAYFEKHSTWKPKE
jgi:hypothetical protein